MPRGVAEAGSGFEQLKQQGRALLTALRREIQTKESELKRLKEEASRLESITAAAPAHSSDGVAAPSRTSGKRINWGEVIEQLPKQFQASDIRSIEALKDKRSAEIFAAITRWIEAKKVKRKARGLYERVG